MQLKKGDKLLCKENTYYFGDNRSVQYDLTIGKNYTISHIDVKGVHGTIGILSDSKHVNYFKIDSHYNDSFNINNYFHNLKEMRKKKLEKLSNV